MLFPRQASVRSTRENMIHVWKPTPFLKNPLSALRSHRYDIDDDFIGEATQILSRNVTGRGDATKTILDKAKRKGVIKFSDRADTLIDYNPFNDLWKFVIILNKFPGDRRHANYTLILTGICEGEPVLRNGTASDECELIVQHRTVIQSYNSISSQLSGAYTHKTRSDSSLLYGHMVGQCANNKELYENRPSSFNYIPDLGGMADKPIYSADPQMSLAADDYGAGAVQFDRRDNSPDVVMKKLVDSISKHIRQKNSSGDLEGSDVMTSIHDPVYDVSAIAEDLQQSDRRGGVILSHIGPGTIIRLKDLSRDYGIDQIDMAKLSDESLFTDEDPLEASIRNSYYGLLESLLPAVAGANQISSIYMEVTTDEDQYGDMIRTPRIQDVKSYIEGIPPQELKDKAYRLFDYLDAAVFSSLADIVGGFTITIDLNMMSRSFLNINIFDEPTDPDAAYSFTTGFNNFSVPTIAAIDSVRHNQEQVGNMIHQIVAEQDYSTRTLLDLTATTEEEYDRRNSDEPPRTFRGYDEPRPKKTGLFDGFGNNLFDRTSR